MAVSDPRFDQFPEIAELFDRPSLDDWREIAEASLRGRPLDRLTVPTHEGLSIRPLYSEADTVGDPGFPGQAPFVRGRTALGPGAGGWEVSQRVGHPDPTVAAAWAVEDLARGANSVWLVFGRATRTADEEVGAVLGDGVRLCVERDLDPFFEGIDLTTTPVHLTAGGGFAAVAAMLVAAARRNGVDPRELVGSLGCDPLGALATDGVLPAGLDGSLEQLAALSRWSLGNTPELRTITVSTIPYHLAGATAVHELAFALATAVEYLRALTDHGIDGSAACRQIAFRHAIGRDLFMEAAKLRATRRVWARVAGACGATDLDRAGAIHAVASPRNLTTRDPWVNNLRTTVGSFAAMVGGADVLTVLPYDAAIGLPDATARRIATNSQTILREESHLGRVVDPGGGSWYLEHLTDRLAQAAWDRFQTIESEGGMAASLMGGTIAQELAEARSGREQSLATGRDPITGVSSYPNLAEEQQTRPTAGGPATPTTEEGPAAELGRLFKVANEPIGDDSLIEIAIEAAAAGATVTQLMNGLRATRQLTEIPPLPARRESEIFENLRDASDEWLEEKGARPSIFLANMGPVAEHKPRAAFATNFFEAGGIEAPSNPGFATIAEAADAFAEAGTSMAVICSSDVRYADVVPDLAHELEKRGARAVLVAGKPGEFETLWRASGVTGFIHMGCDHYRMLIDLLQEEGVLHV